MPHAGKHDEKGAGAAAEGTGDEVCVLGHGESIALAWGRLKIMLYSCAIHELLLFRIFMLGFLAMINP